MASRSCSLLLVSFLALAGMNAETSIKKIPVKRTSPASGQEMFVTYCAVCHGKEGKGNGPAATALKKTPANLTELTQRNGGKFPELKVYSTIKGDSETPAHGARDMPMWGSLLGSVSGSEGEVQLRIAGLTAYVESLQGK
jgi:mono/diheme cytochrome c family protein